MEIRENQLILNSINQPIYYIAPVAQRHLMNQGAILKMTLKETENQWTAVLCLLIDENKKGFPKPKETRKIQD